MGMVSVPACDAVAKNPKVVDMTSINVYPSKYRITNGEVVIKSINIEDVEQQQEALRSLHTTVLLGDMIRLEFKFGHYAGGRWLDYFISGTFRVKGIVPNPKTREILVKVSKV